MDVDIPFKTDHRRQSSDSSASSSVFQLASSINLASSGRSGVSVGKEKKSLLAKITKHHPHPWRHHHNRSNSDMEWQCKGEDLESNFWWPEDGLGEIANLPEHIERRLSQAAMPGLRYSAPSISSIDSEDGLSILTPSSSRPSSTIPGMMCEVLPSVITDAEDPLFSEFANLPSLHTHDLPQVKPRYTGQPQHAQVKENSSTKRLSSLGNPIQLEAVAESPAALEIKPLQLKRSSKMTDSPNTARRKQEEGAAISSINDFFNSPPQRIDSIATSAFCRAQREPLPLRQGSVDFTVRALPPVPVVASTKTPPTTEATAIEDNGTKARPLCPAGQPKASPAEEVRQSRTSAINPTFIPTYIKLPTEPNKRTSVHKRTYGFI